jgi:hypothetical protein
MKIRLSRNLGLMVLGIWLVLWGLSSLGLSFPGIAVVLAILAIAAGLLLLIGR